MFDGWEAQRFRTTTYNTDVHHDLLALSISKLAKNLYNFGNDYFHEGSCVFVSLSIVRVGRLCNGGFCR